VFDGLFEFCQLSAGGSVGKLSCHMVFLADVYKVVLPLLQVGLRGAL